MPKRNMVIVVEHTQAAPLSLEEVCAACHISTSIIQDFIDYGIINLEGAALEKQQFTLDHLYRIKAALRLQRDLEVNLAGAAIVLNLLDELQTLRERMAILEKHYL